ncbi:MAG TPA: HAMP domain-containing sensor histidine kinase [Acidimicrobiales bacterium]|nr:HAMP domain-containing sensor histidine kinase [Acidimicrobiales bacterium]
MRARITIAFVVTLATALLVASVASLLLVRHASSISAQRTVLKQASAIERNPSVITSPGVVSLIREIAGINSASIIVVNSNGRIVSDPPPNLPASIIDTALLIAGKVTSGAHRHIAFAAVPMFSTSATKGVPARTVALVFESKENFSVANVLYFALAGFISLIVAAGFSIEISKRISRHVRGATDAARQIATGDFSARMNVPYHGYPELVELQDSLNLMANDLERSREAQREFLLSISHELRTPLTSIRGYAEAIVEGQINAPADAALVVISESDRLARLIEDLLSMARLSAHQFTFRIEPCDLTATATNATEALRYSFEEAGVELRVDTPEQHLLGETDADRLGQVVSNLVENALKYSKNAVDVVIGEDASRSLTVAVGDDGHGIDSADQSRVFERLFTSDRHSTRKVGTGLGLAIVAELTEALGGTIEIISPRDELGGTVFQLRVPFEMSVHRSI